MMASVAESFLISRMRRIFKHERISMPDSFILTINAGSSSLKFALFRAGQAPACELAGKFERIGLPEGKLTVTDVATNKRLEKSFQGDTHIACVPLLAQMLEHKAEV